MHTQQKSETFSYSALLKALSDFPSSWVLTPVCGNKAPYRVGWQNEQPVCREEIAKDIRAVKAKGIGLRTGRISGGIVAIDADGPAAHEKILEVSGGQSLPETVSFSSNRPGRCQYLFYIPSEYWEAVRTIKIATGVKDEDGKEQKIELRWDGCQSVLPPSAHPYTKVYSWRKSFAEVEIAPAPMWVIEAMLIEKEVQQPQRQTTAYTRKARTGEQWSNTEWALSYLSALNPCRADDYDEWLAVGMALHSADDSLLTEWDTWSRQSSKYKPGACEKKWKSFKSQGISIASLGHMAKEDGWRSPFEKSTNFVYQEKQGDRLAKNRSVTGDSQVSGDSYDSGILSVTATVTSVTDILENGFSDWIEINKLEDVKLKSELKDKAFYALVNSLKSQFDDVQPNDEVKLKALIDWHNAELDFHSFLPSMASDILHDAKILNIDPIGVWQYLLPTVLSLAGKRVNLDVESHVIPAIAWTVLLAESGSGKTRAKNLVIKPLETLQHQAEECFKAKFAEWEENMSNWKEGDGKKPPRPVERKYLFQVGTIQAVMRRQSEQGMNGSVWVRDELLGLFQSLKQFDQKENEALSCLAESWDGGDTHVDRVKQEDSYSIKNPRLSITGGLQPGVFKKAFQDPDDSQGLQARFLFAQMKPQKPKRTKGFCRLSEKLPPMYQWLDTLPEGRIKLSIEADKYYDKLYETIGEQAFNTAMPAIRAWMFKLPAQLLRIALGLHLIECYHDCNRPLWTLQKDTLERAVLVAQYYRSAFHIIQTTAAKTDDLSAILLQIWDKAVTRHPEGISVRDAYRDIKAIKYRAKDANRPIAAYTAELFNKLAEMGKGAVVQNGRLVKFVANATPSPIPPDKGGEQKPENPDTGDRVTVAKTIALPALEVSPKSEVSPVTVQNDMVTDVLQTEVLTSQNSMMLLQAEIEEHRKLAEHYRELAAKREARVVQLLTVQQQADSTAEATLNPQLKMLTTIATLEIIEIYTEPYFEWEEVVSAAVTVISAEETWEAVQRTIELLELDKAQKDEVKHRLAELGHTAKIRQLYEKAHPKQVEPERMFQKGDRVQYQHWYGTLAAHVSAGWLVQWDKLSKSCIKRHGEIPANAKHPLKEVDLKLISKATHG